MIAWFADNWLSLIVGLIVVALVALCLRNLLPGKHQVCCGGNCAGCTGCCTGCHAQPKTKP